MRNGDARKVEGVGNPQIRLNREDCRVQFQQNLNMYKAFCLPASCKAVLPCRSTFPTGQLCWNTKHWSHAVRPFNTLWLLSFKRSEWPFKNIPDDWFLLKIWTQNQRMDQKDTGAWDSCLNLWNDSEPKKPGQAKETVAKILASVVCIPPLSVPSFLKSFYFFLHIALSVLLSQAQYFLYCFLLPITKTTPLTSVTIKTLNTLATASKTSSKVIWSCWLTVSWVTLSDGL